MRPTGGGSPLRRRVQVAGAGCLCGGVEVGSHCDAGAYVEVEAFKWMPTCNAFRSAVVEADGICVFERRGVRFSQVCAF